MNEALNALALAVAAMRAAFRLPAAGRRVLWQQSSRQILFTGIEGIPLVALLASAVGVLVIVQSAHSLPDFGQAEFMGRLLVLLITKELGPILVAFVVVARSGAAIAAELSTMRTRGEIDGLMGIGVDPLVYLVVPRMVGVTVAVCSLTVVFNIVAFLAGFGFAAASRASLTFVGLLSTLFQAMTWQDIALSAAKSAGFGTAIAAVCTYFGLSAAKASTEVPRVTLRAMVNALSWCVAIELVMTTLFMNVGDLTR